MLFSWVVPPNSFRLTACLCRDAEIARLRAEIATLSAQNRGLQQTSRVAAAASVAVSGGGMAVSAEDTITKLTSAYARQRTQAHMLCCARVTNTCMA